MSGDGEASGLSLLTHGRGLLGADHSVRVVRDPSPSSLVLQAILLLPEAPPRARAYHRFGRRRRRPPRVWAQGVDCGPTPGLSPGYPSRLPLLRGPLSWTLCIHNNECIPSLTSLPASGEKLSDYTCSASSIFASSSRLVARSESASSDHSTRDRSHELVRLVLYDEGCEELFVAIPRSDIVDTVVLRRSVLAREEQLNWRSAEFTSAGLQ